MHSVNVFSNLIWHQYRVGLVSVLIKASRKYGVKPKLITELDEKLVLAIENDELKPRRHPGIMKTKTTEIPDKIRKAIQVILRDQPVKTLFGQGEALARYLLARHPPTEKAILKSTLTGIQQSIEEEYGIDASSLDENERERLLQKYKGHAQEKLKKRVYSWQPIAFNHYTSLQYMVGRSAAEFAVLQKIFSELKTRSPDFDPQSIFDFGSGLGTASWASHSLWGNSIKEYFNVDSSGEMNDLASMLLRDGNETKELSKGVYYRQFLPSSDKIKYDIVVSAYSLLELPSSQSRLETVLNLWNKSQGFLVLVEQGTNAGFRVINEARDFLLHVSENRNDGSASFAHVFAPCSHDLPCPRFSTSKIPCNFEISYFPLNFGKRLDVRREKFSYVVLKRGLRREDDPQWPRLISPTLIRSKHAVCRMCMSNGKLDEIIFTASKHGKIPYRCAKSSDWGDLLPMKITQENESIVGLETIQTTSF